jgi:hypothetical protein
MAGFDDFPLAPQQPPAADPWAQFPMAGQPPAAPPSMGPIMDGGLLTPPRADAPQPAPAPAGAPVQDDRGWMEYIWDTGNIGAEGFVRGATNVLGAPADLINAAPMLANLLPGEQGVGPMSDYPIGGSQSLQDLIFGTGDAITGAAAEGLKALGAPEGVLTYDPVAQDVFQRGVSRVGEEMGAAAIPAGALVGAGARMGVQGARNGGALSRLFVEPAAVDPSKFVAKEMAAATAAGMGATAANEVFENQDRSNPLVDFLGALGGVGLAGTGGVVARGLRDLAAAATGSTKYAGEIVRNAVTDEMIRNSTTLGQQVDAARPDAPIDTAPLADAIMRPSDAEQIVPGFQASTADRAGDAGLASLENARSRNNPGAFRARADENTQAIERTMSGMAPDETPAAFREALEAGRDRALTDVSVRSAEAQANYDRAVSGLSPLMTGEARGADIRAALEGASEKAKAIVSEAWRPVNEADATVNIAPLRDAFDTAGAQVPEALQPLLPAASAVPGRLATPAGPEVPTGILDASGRPITRPGAPSGEVQPISEVMGIRSALSNDLRRDGITPQEVRLIEDHIAKLDAYIEQALPDTLRQQYDTARTASRDYHDRFTRGNTAIGQALRVTEGGGYQAPDSGVARKFVQGDQGRISDTEALFKEAGSDPRAVNAVRDQILQDARDRGVMQSPAALDQFIKDNSQLLARYPELKAELGEAGKLRSALTDAQGNETRLRTELTSPGKSPVANYLQYGDERAVDAIKGVIAARDPAKAVDDLLNFVGDAPQAVEGARAAFWKHMDASARSRNMAAETESGLMPFVPKRLAAFLDNPANAAVAQRLYRDNPEHLADIRTLAEALRGTNTANKVGISVNPSGTAQMMRGQAPVSMAELGSKFYQMQLGRVSPAYVAAHLAGKISARAVGSQRAKAFEALLDKALLDPETARLLLQENNPANRAALARKVGAWKLNHGDVLTQMLSEDEQSPDDEIKGKVMEGQQ